LYILAALRDLVRFQVDQVEKAGSDANAPRKLLLKYFIDLVILRTPVITASRDFIPMGMAHCQYNAPGMAGVMAI